MSRPDPMPAGPAPDDDAFVDAVKTGQAALDQGRTVPYEKVRDWLLSWGSKNELPPPECP